jgi:hypothetical protein
VSHHLFERDRTGIYIYKPTPIIHASNGSIFHAQQQAVPMFVRICVPAGGGAVLAIGIILESSNAPKRSPTPTMESWDKMEDAKFRSGRFFELESCKIGIGARVRISRVGGWRERRRRKNSWGPCLHNFLVISMEVFTVFFSARSLAKEIYHMQCLFIFLPKQSGYRKLAQTGSGNMRTTFWLQKLWAHEC